MRCSSGWRPMPCASRSERVVLCVGVDGSSGVEVDAEYDKDHTRETLREALIDLVIPFVAEQVRVQKSMALKKEEENQAKQRAFEKIQRAFVDKKPSDVAKACKEAGVATALVRVPVYVVASWSAKAMVGSLSSVGRRGLRRDEREGRAPQSVGGQSGF